MKTKMNLQATPEPDPIALGEELANYIQARYKKNLGALVNLGVVDGGGNHMVVDRRALDFLELIWERDFWQAKALGIKPPQIS